MDPTVHKIFLGHETIVPCRLPIFPGTQTITPLQFPIYFQLPRAILTTAGNMQQPLASVINITILSCPNTARATHHLNTFARPGARRNLHSLFFFGGPPGAHVHQHGAQVLHLTIVRLNPDREKHNLRIGLLNLFTKSATCSIMFSKLLPILISKDHD